MTKQHFRAVARAIRTADLTALGSPGLAARARLRLRIAQAVADELQRDNPLFDRSRFIRAAMGPEERVPEIDR